MLAGIPRRPNVENPRENEWCSSIMPVEGALREWGISPTLENPG
jgi:hypothetical protein